MILMGRFSRSNAIAVSAVEPCIIGFIFDTPVKMRSCEDRTRRSALAIGQDTDAVWENILHMSADEMSRLHWAAVI